MVECSNFRNLAATMIPNHRRDSMAGHGRYSWGMPTTLSGSSRASNHCSMHASVDDRAAMASCSKALDEVAAM